MTHSCRAVLLFSSPITEALEPGNDQHVAPKRTDAERRARQCERLSRLLRVLQLITGPGRWDAEALANELECSTRTVHRLLQVLELAQVPFYFDDATRAYKVRPGYKFTALDPSSLPPRALGHSQAKTLVKKARRALAVAEQLAKSLRAFCDAAEQKRDG